MPTDGRENASMPRFLDHRREKVAWERRIVEFARAHHDVIDLGELADLGLSPRAVQDRARQLRLYRKCHRVYAVGRPDLPPRGEWFAAVKACGEGALLSHRSAAALRDLLRVSGAIHVTIPRRSALKHPGIHVHRSTCLTPIDQTEVDGIPCTSVPWTLLDVAATEPRHLLERACNQAEIQGILDYGAIDELLERRAGQPGVRRLRAVLQSGHVGEGIPKTVMERRFLSLCRRFGLPRPAVNQPMAVPGEQWECDFVWHRERVVVEVDGWKTHQTKRAFQEDRRRDQLLRLEGWQVVRFTWDDVTERPEHVAKVVRAMLATAARAA
jgi:Protein of unknown function (DUF559)